MTFRTIAVKALASTLIIATSSLLLASEPVSIDYHFGRDTGVNLGAIAGGPLSINTFTDGRKETGSTEISRAGREPLTTNTSPAELVQSAFEQAFIASGATLAGGGTNLSLDGRLLEIQVVENDEGMQVLIRCELTLRNQSRNAWQSVLFSQVSTDDKNIQAVIALGLDRLVSELFMDDYFLMELGIF